MVVTSRTSVVGAWDIMDVDLNIKLVVIVSSVRLVISADTPASCVGVA